MRGLLVVFGFAVAIWCCLFWIVYPIYLIRKSLRVRRHAI